MTTPLKKLILWNSLLVLLCPSCMKTDIIGEVEMQMDTLVVKKPHRPPLPPLPPRDTTSVDDTSRVGIGFNPTVEDWEETDVDM